MHPPAHLQTAVVVEPGPTSCVVVSRGQRSTVRYAAPFGSRATELRPGHLVALADGEPASIVWRWFDAVVVRRDTDGVRLWEPAHGEVTGTPRRPDVTYGLGTRAYVSAGLPGADWWLAGPTGGAPEDADVELDEVVAFYDTHALWERLTS